MQTVISLRPDAGPSSPPSSAARRGLFDGPPVWRWQAGPRSAQASVELGRVVIEPGARLEVAIFCAHDEQFASCEAWFELDGIAAVDQYGHSPARRADGDLPWLVTDQWNLVAIDTSDLVPGSEVAVSLTLPAGGAAQGWVQLLGQFPVPVATDDPVELVRTSRGSHSRHGHSRGNTYPMACLPHGFNFISPISDARAGNWIFTWHPDGGAKLQALAFCHAPSPWIGDRANVQLMPWTGSPQIEPAARERGYDPRELVDRPHLVRVPLDDGTIAEATPTDHGAVFRFRFEGASRRGVVVDLARSGRTTVRLRADGRAEISGHVRPEVEWNRRQLAPVGYFWGITRQPVQIVAPRRSRLGADQRPQAAVLELLDGDELEVAMATSFISVGQARHNLDLEVGEARFDEVCERAHEAWAELLGRFTVGGASHAQLVHAYSNLARLHCWPNSMHENLGTAEEPRWAHASPFLPTSPRKTDESSASPLVAGTIMVNNGYWDTYRTCWPAFNLFTPDLAGELTDGLLAAWRESGWMGRWSAPGHVDCMVGTSSDVIFADASRHGIDFDEVAGYDSALRNACCPSADSTVGRVGIGRGRFVGVVDTSTGEGFSWSIENAICDATIALWSSRLAERADELGIAGRVAELRANAVWFANRARAVRQLFDPGVGFHRGTTRGKGRGASFDPLDWGGDFTETNAWGMSVSTVQDALALAADHGGPAGLGEHLDRLFDTPERADHPGAYGQVIHEMVEARSLRLGQCALSNQPAHHIPFMYAFTDRPWRTQEVVADALRRLFVGNEIGQGYPGDEDNGEFSAWWLFCSVGLYPLLPGSGEFVLTTPRFPSHWRRDGGDLEVRAHGEGDFIERVAVNGRPHRSLTIGVDELRGACTIDVWRSPSATDFGVGQHPWALAPDEPWRADLASRATVRVRRHGRWSTASSLVNDHGDVTTELSAGDEVELLWPDQQRLEMLTLTLARPGQVRVRLQAEGDEVDLPERVVQWPDQTIAWQVGRPITTSRLRIVATSSLALQQVECW